jgi:hypothetical protein
MDAQPQDLSWASDLRSIRDCNFWKHITPEQWKVKPKDLKQYWRSIFPDLTEREITALALCRRNQSPERKIWRKKKDATPVGKEALKHRSSLRSLFAQLKNMESMTRQKYLKFVAKCKLFGIDNPHDFKSYIELSLPENMTLNDYYNSRKTYHLDHVFPIDIAVANKDLFLGLYEFSISAKNVMIIDKISNLRKNDMIILELLPEHIINAPEFKSLNLTVYATIEDAGLDRKKYENYLLAKALI